MTWIMLVSMLGLTFILLLIVAILWVMWRNKRQRHNELELLLDDIKDRQAPRGKSLARRVGEKFNLEQANAQDLSEQLIAAEKVFLQQFIEQQLHQKSVENVYQQLCELLDSYLSVMPGQDLAKEKQANKPEIEQALEARDIETGSASAHETIPESDWGDVFD